MVKRLPKGSIAHYISPGGNKGSSQQHTSQINVAFGFFECKTGKHLRKKLKNKSQHKSAQMGNPRWSKTWLFSASDTVGLVI